MKTLGNKFIETRTGPSIQIAEPHAADELLDLAIVLARQKQRLLFFCSCEWPRSNGQIECHRATVGELVLKAAQEREISVEVSEWPGSNPERIELEVTDRDFAAIKKGRVTIPLGEQSDMAVMAGLPWGSIATLNSKGESLHRVVGPANHQGKLWALPVLYQNVDPTTGLGEYEQQAANLRKDLGLESVLS
jgi:hypothetical protein